MYIYRQVLGSAVEPLLKKLESAVEAPVEEK